MEMFKVKQIDEYIFRPILDTFVNIYYFQQRFYRHQCDQNDPKDMISRVPSICH